MAPAPYFDSRDPACKAPFGAVKAGEEVKFSVHLPKGMTCTACRLKLFPADGGEMVVLPMGMTGGDYKHNRYTAAFVGEIPAVWFYHFELDDGYSTQTLTRGPGNAAVLGGWEGWQLTVYKADMHTPAALREGIIYQIFPDRFCNSGQPKENVPDDRILRHDWDGLPEWRPNELGKVLNNDFFGGDLKGITQKLDYLRELGVTCIYLNPIFEAHSNHRYDTADYKKIDPILGSEADFSALTAAAKERGIAVILDGVFSHTGADSVYFNRSGRYGEGGAYRDRESEYASWFRFKDWPDDYESWWGFITLPNVEETEPSYIEFIAGEDGVAQKWLNLGASGFRLDVADELPDVFLDALYARVKAHSPDNAVIGEVWEDASHKIAYGYRRHYLLGWQMDSVMNYPFKDALLHYIRYGGGEGFLNTVMGIVENYPPPVLAGLMNSLSTHDTERAITALGGEHVSSHGREWQHERQTLSCEQYKRGRDLFALAAIIQYGLPGMPCLYYGDEAGMAGYKDPFNRACYPWGSEDRDLVVFFKNLGQIRLNNPIFTQADFTPITFSNEVCSFVRRGGEVEVLFAVNRGDGFKHLTLPAGFETAQAAATYGQYSQGVLSPYSGVVLVKRR
ncbi:MAG: glycoside hydrolase family 13 protein [Oscillospiraceae bacterium]|nr:glycoside hydrolase family 13 protein [Oscillospiraceae bacterium]